MNIRYMTVVDALILLKRKNDSKSKDSPFDTSCIPVELFNKLREWGYIEVRGNTELRITEKGKNIISFNQRSCAMLQDVLIEI